MDYLSIEGIVEAGYSPACGYTPEEIKNAALCLMLNPNAMWARFALCSYAFCRILRGDNLIQLAAVSATAKRLAKSIYIYNRYEIPLKNFIYHCYRYAKLDVYGLLHHHEDAHVITLEAASRFFDEALADYHTQTSEAIGAWSKIDKLIAEIIGGKVKFPLRKRAQDGTLIPIPFLLLQMSQEELETALALCAAHGDPVDLAMTGLPRILTDCEKRAKLERFACWCRQQKRPPRFSEVDQLIYSEYYLHGKNIPAIVALCAEKGIPRTYGQVQHCIFAKFRKAFQVFETSEGCVQCGAPGGQSAGCAGMQPQNP